MSKLPLIAVTGGGTGGHVEPVWAVIEELQKHAVELCWIGAKNGLESAAARELKIPFVPVRVGKIRRYFAWANVSDLVNIAVGFGQCLWFFIRQRPRVLFSKAGYVSVPALLAAATLGIPVVAHESDTVIGLANHIASLIAKRFCTGFALPFYGDHYSKKMVFTGNPVRVVLPESLLHFQTDMPVLTVIGGSQGSATLNSLVWDMLPSLLNSVTVVHQVGPEHEHEAAVNRHSLTEAQQKRYHMRGYFNRPTLSFILFHSSVVVSRAGANAIADLSYFSVPAILIPLPSAAGNHQTINAQYVVERGGAMMLHQVDATPQKIETAIKTMLENTSRRSLMAKAMHSINPPHADQKVADEILRVARGQE